MELNNKIIINGVEYIKLSKYEELQKKKEVVKEVTKEVIKEVIVDKIKLEDYAILDYANVMGIFPLVKKDDYSDLETINASMGTFKKVDNPKIVINCSSIKCEDKAITIEDSKYSKEYIDKIIKIGKLFLDEEPVIYMIYKDDKFIKDMPIMLVFGSRLCFILAPRVGDNEE